MRFARWAFGLGLLVLVSISAYADNRTCLVVGVSDGDTITARCGFPGSYDQVKVRINGVDAPEKKQPFGQRAKEAMSDLVFGRSVDLACHKVDRYGRSVCKVSVNGRDVGLEMLALGMAWWYRSYAKEQSREDRANYETMEAQARESRLGLWRDANPVAPWEWRKERRP